MSAPSSYPTASDARSKKSRRCFHRVISGLKRGGRVRFLTLTSSDAAPDDIQRSWRCLQMRMVRRGLMAGYIRVPETAHDGRKHLHILFRGAYVEQCLIKRWWQEIHQSDIVDIRLVQLGRQPRRVANYMAKYMSKESAGRYSWSWGWVWRGFCKDWQQWKYYWRQYFERPGYTSFRNCITGWDWWLKDLIRVDRSALFENMPPPFVITLPDPFNPGCYQPIAWHRRLA
ncbi:hypothetical protein ES705_22755 [subsurface metagenome]